MPLSYTEITENFTDPTTGLPLSNVYVSFQVSQVLYIGGEPTVTPGSPISARVTNGALLGSNGSPLQLIDAANSVAFQSGTGFWWWTVTITGDISDSWSFQLPHSASPVELYSTKYTTITPTVSSVFGRTGVVTAQTGDYTASQVGALPISGGTLTGAVIVAVVSLSQSGGNVAVDADDGNDFRLTLTASGWTIKNPSNLVDGQDITFLLTQDSTGSRTVSWDTQYDFGAAGAPVLSTTGGQADLVGFKCVGGGSGKLLCLGAALGF